MKQFNIEEYLKNPSRQVVTRDGRKARIVCTDRESIKPVVALITLPNGYEVIKTFWDNGIETAGSEYKNDLFFAPIKHEGWVNVFEDTCGNRGVGSRIFNSKEDAEKEAKNFGSYLATIKIEWEE